MILIVGWAEETTLAHFINHIRLQGDEHDVLDLGRVRHCDELFIEHSPSGLRVRLDKDWFALENYTAIYNRAFYLDIDISLRRSALHSLLGELSGYLSISGALVVNRPYAGLSNANKLLHLMELGEAGFLTPPAFVTSCSDEAATRIEPDGTWISKSCSSAKTQAVPVDAMIHSRFHHLHTCPSQFQRFAKGFDVRVHVIGSEVIGLRVDSQILDYRFERLAVKRNVFTACDIPKEIVARCYSYCRANDLLFAGFDFKVSSVDSAEEWYVLEANPMPGYEYFDRHLDSQISSALLSLLRTGPLINVPSQPVKLEPLITNERRPAIRLK